MSFLHTRVGNPCYYLASTLDVVVVGGVAVVYDVVLKFAWSKTIFYKKKNEQYCKHSTKTINNNSRKQKKKTKNKIKVIFIKKTQKQKENPYC